VSKVAPHRSKVRLNARLSLEKDRARARELRRLLLCAAALAAPLLGYVWQRVDFLRVSYRVEELQKQRGAIQELNKQMTVERALLLAPDRIERLARERLGLVEPHPENVRRVQLIDGRLDTGGPVARAPQDRLRGRETLAAVGLFDPPHRRETRP
jgi:cell division protein FtsL